MPSISHPIARFTAIVLGPANEIACLGADPTSFGDFRCASAVPARLVQAHTLRQGLPQQVPAVRLGISTAPCHESVRPHQRRPTASYAVGCCKAAFRILEILADAI